MVKISSYSEKLLPSRLCRVVLTILLCCFFATTLLAQSLLPRDARQKQIGPLTGQITQPWLTTPSPLSRGIIDPSLILANDGFPPVNYNIGITFPGPVFEDNVAQNGKFFVPPSPKGAVGVDRVIAVVNALVEIRDKSGSLIMQEDLRTFFTSLAPGSESTVANPRIVYDTFEQRFLVAAMEVLEEGVSGSPRILFAVSKNGTPATLTSNDWYYHAVGSLRLSSGLPASFPSLRNPFLAVDEEAVYLTVDLLSGTTISSNDDVDAQVLIFDKGTGGGFYAGGTSGVTRHSFYGINGTVANSLTTFVPAMVYGSGGIPGGNGEVGTYFVTFGLAGIQVFRVDDPLGKTGGPLFSVQTIQKRDFDYGLAAAPQPGGTGFSDRINTGDPNVSDCVWRDGVLWVAMVGAPVAGPDAGQTTVHWLKLNTSAAPQGPVTLDDQGDIGGETLAPGTFTFAPSLAVNTAGDVQFGFSASSPTSFLGVYTAGRSASDPPGKTRPPEPVAEGQDFYQRILSGNYFGLNNQWSEISSISTDPSNDSQFWLFNAYAGLRENPAGSDNGRWETVWASVTLPDLSMQPLMLFSPQSVDFGNVFVDDSGEMEIRIENFGGADLVLDDIVSPGVPFSTNLSVNSLTIPALGTATITVYFSPMQPGNFAESLTFSTNDPAKPTVTIQINADASVINPAKRDVFYAILPTNTSRRLLAVEPATGTIREFREMNVYSSDLAIDSKGILYLVVNTDLYKFDPVTGAHSVFARIGLPGINTAAFGHNDLLYISAIDFMNEGNDLLYTYDLQSGELKLVGPTGKNINEITFDPTDGTLWATGGDSRTVGQGRDSWDFIFTIDLDTGLATELGQVGIQSIQYWTSVEGLGIDSNGNLYGTVQVTSSRRTYFSINKNTITPTVISSFSAIPAGGWILNGFAAFNPNIPSGIDDGSTHQIPDEFVLLQNYPNPFNPVTTIGYTLNENADVTVEIFDVLGKHVKTLVNTREIVGSHTVQWDGRSESGVRAASGMYVCTIKANDLVKSMKMILMN